MDFKSTSNNSNNNQDYSNVILFQTFVGFI